MIASAFDGGVTGRFAGEDQHRPRRDPTAPRRGDPVTRRYAPEPARIPGPAGLTGMAAPKLAEYAVGDPSTTCLVAFGQVLAVAVLGAGGFAARRWQAGAPRADRRRGPLGDPRGDGSLAPSHRRVAVRQRRARVTMTSPAMNDPSRTGDNTKRTPHAMRPR